MRVFNETQRFTQWWLQAINISLIAFLLYALYTWYIENGATGNVTANDTTGQLIVIFSTVPVVVFLYLMKMTTTIDEVGIHYRFWPFHASPRTIRWTDMDDCYVRKYRPIAEYGGWGLRGSFGKNTAYNVKGNIGIQTVLKTGKKVLVGTQKEKEAVRVIERYYKKGTNLV